MSRKLALTVVALLFAGLSVAAFALIPRGDDQKMIVTAQFEDSIGLYEGNAVSVLGMPVGKVTSIVPKASYVEVKFELDKGVDIPADVKAVTVSTSILTDRHVELTPVYRDGPRLQNGDVLGLTRTRTPVEFDRTLAMVDKLAISLSGDSKGQGPLADLINIGDQIASGSGPDIKATLDELSQALRLGADNGADTSKTIQAVAANLADLTQAAADNDATIREFGSHVSQLSDILADENLGAGTTGAKINQILDQAVSLLETNREGLKSTVTDVGALAAVLNDHRRDVAETLDLLPMLADNIYNTVDLNAGAIRAHIDPTKVLLDSQVTKEVCNLAGLKDLGCATGTISDYSPDFGATFWLDGVTGMLKLMAGVQ